MREREKLFIIIPVLSFTRTPCHCLHSLKFMNVESFCVITKIMIIIIIEGSSSSSGMAVV
jgi:hypothetical protein